MLSCNVQREPFNDAMKKIHLLLIMSAFLILSCSGDDNTPVDGKPDIVEMPGPDPVVDTLSGFTRCENGMAGIYPCGGYDFLGRISLEDFDAESGNDSWGWTDPATGKEYALMGLDNGTAFVDITDTENLVYLGKLSTATEPSSWRDVKVYRNHAFIVSEAEGHGMQVFDLTRLRNVTNPPETFDADVRYTGFGNAHNIVINEETGVAYAVGTRTFDGGPHFINIADPKNPVALGGYVGNGYTHDAQVVTYNGPDTDYIGREIFIGANENIVVLVDVTDKENPTAISSIGYEKVEYTHQGWFTEDQKYFLLGDELDETKQGFNSRTLIFDFSDLDNPVLHDTYLADFSAIDHNGYVKGNEFFLANYTAGVRILDISKIAEKSILETGFFDTFPVTDNARFDGVWSVYPYFDSGKIVVSDINSGLFVIKKSQ